MATPGFDTLGARRRRRRLSRRAGRGGGSPALLPTLAVGAWLARASGLRRRRAPAGGVPAHGWTSWQAAGGPVVDTRPCAEQGRVARRAAGVPRAADAERAEFLLVPEARHGRWALEGWAQAMALRGHKVHCVRWPRLGDRPAEDALAIEAAASAVSARLAPRRHLVVLGHGLAAAALGRALVRLLAGRPDVARPPVSAAVFAAPARMDAVAPREALSAVAAAASDAGLCQRLLFSPGASAQDVSSCTERLRLGAPLAAAAPDGAGRGGAGAGWPPLAAAGEVGRALSQRILVIGGDADALAPPAALDEVSQAFRAGDPIVLEGCGHSLSLDRRWSGEAVGAILDWTRLLFACGHIAD